MWIDPRQETAAAAAVTEQPENPVSDCLDLDVVAGLLELGDPDFFAELVDDFVTSTGPYLERLASAVAAGDAESVYQTAHAMKSSAANMGATRFSELCRRAEAAGRSGDVGGLDSLVADLTLEYEDVREALAAAAAAARA